MLYGGTKKLIKNKLIKVSYNLFCMQEIDGSAEIYGSNDNAHSMFYAEIQKTLVISKTLIPQNNLLYQRI